MTQPRTKLLLIAVSIGNFVRGKEPRIIARIGLPFNDSDNQSWAMSNLCPDMNTSSNYLIQFNPISGQ